MPFVIGVPGGSEDPREVGPHHEFVPARTHVLRARHHERRIGTEHDLDAVVRVGQPGELEEATLVDLGSRNGTFLDGRKIASPVKLRHRARIQVGSIELVFRVASLGSTTETDIATLSRPPAGD